ncbi:hypothetical protein BD626DRAFT_145681 [Schizophyllum amplum]|uniref:DUF4238 domain-containing protein n=1 Tax=Schizophyllum amplum TaxID=97359 RepID=A0A550C543_9AGAR|nr:hypothetical protein BD626DRAFT_145681 [Auriculariopsis ampla]
MPKRKPTKPRASSPPQSPSSPTFANKDKPIRDQYHHSIPRFILRRYQVGPVLPKPERMKAYRRTGVDPEYVLFYDIENQSLDTRPIGKVYGTKNLYRDAKNSFNVNHLEEKLAQLEKQAATVIKVIHDAIPRHKFTLTRPELDCLRKFLFLMHYRRQTMWVSLFDKDLPGNEDGRDRLEAYGKAKGLKTPADIWLHFLQYFLETPHEQINKEGTKWLKKHKAWDELSDPEKVGTPGAMENFEAMLYQQQAQGFFPGIWEAADGEEFVLTPSSFGMQEGYHYQVREMYMHRIYIISPRLAIVLRNSFLRPEHGGAKFRKNCASVLADYPLEFSEPTYASGRNGIPWDRNASPGELAEALANYRLSEQAQKDTFTFKIFKLTSDQTLDLNKAILHCTAPTGSVTFTSKSFMVRSLNYYMRRVPLWQDPKKRPRYEALLEQLLRPPKEPAPPSVEVVALNERAFTFVMSLLLRSTRTPSSVSVYNCASTFIQQLPFLVAIGGDTDFVRDHRRGISAVLAHLYHIPKSKREAAGDYVIRPASFATIATNILLEAGRPLLQVAAPSLICSARSSDLDRLLEATVIVRILDASVENRRLRTALRSECPALAAFLIKVAKPPSHASHPNPARLPKRKPRPKLRHHLHGPPILVSHPTSVFPPTPP